MSATAALREASDLVPIEHETSERVVRTMVFALPPAAVALGGWLAWGGALHWQDQVVLAITYPLTGLGITVGYHRLFTHRSFKTTRTLRALADRDLRFISRTFPLWVLVGLAVPFALGVALTGSVAGGLTGLLWGGAVRIFLLQHVTFSINSLCPFFGQRPFATGDRSRNLAWLAPLAFGEAWHNTTTPSPPPPGTDWAAGSSIRALG